MIVGGVFALVVANYNNDDDKPVAQKESQKESSSGGGGNGITPAQSDPASEDRPTGGQSEFD